MVSVKDFGAVGDGFAEDTLAVQRALDCCGEVLIPQGKYRICRTLRVHSGTKILAEPNARICMDGETHWKRGEYLLENDNQQTGARDIAICGGIWDGNNKGKNIVKGDIFDLTGYSGTVLNFRNVKGLELRDLTVANSLTYNIRMAGIDGFVIENISFLSDVIAYNQDGLHFNGGVRNGRLKNIRAVSWGQTNDDLIALNADDSMERVENVGMIRGDIENITFENLFAENCHTLIRLLSVTSAIRNITIKNVYGGFRCYAINADAARYCRTPLFSEEDCPRGVGYMENVRIENMTCYYTGEDPEGPAITLESLTDGLEIRNFRFVKNGGRNPALLVRNVTGMTVTADGVEYGAREKTDVVRLENFEDLTVRRDADGICI